MVVSKDYRIIDPKQNSTIAQLSRIFTQNQEKTRLPYTDYFENDLS